MTFAIAKSATSAPGHIESPCDLQGTKGATELQDAEQSTWPSPAVCTSKTSKRFIDEDSKSPEYRSDSWRMANFKIVPCGKRYAHDWTICPFAHPGEKARRRDPKLFNYAGIACPDMKKANSCSKGDKCAYAHNVFEFWLHPTRYRTQLCNDGTSCTRHVCFFAHTLEEMRSPPASLIGITKGDQQDGQLSPDNPFVHSSSSLLTNSSTSSTEVWGMLSPEDRGRPSSAFADESCAKAYSGTSNVKIEDLEASLANMKLAMTGENRKEVMGIVFKMLEEASEETNRETIGQPETMQSRHADLMQALTALHNSKAQAPLADSSLQETGQKAEHENGDRGDMQAATRPLLPAAAVLELPAARSASQQLPAVQPRPSRVLSADMGASCLPPAARYAQQNSGDVLPGIPRGPPSSFVRRMSTPDPALGNTQLQALDSRLFARHHLQPSNWNALRRQAFHYDEALAARQPRREVRRPPISAFQNAAAEEWKVPPGRCTTGDLNWSNSGGRGPSVDLDPIDESLMARQYGSTSSFYSQASCQESSQGIGVNVLSSMDPSSSISTSGYLPAFHFIPNPLNFPSTIPGGRDSSALHSAPFNLSMAYSNDHQATPQQIVDAPAWSYEYPI